MNQTRVFSTHTLHITPLTPVHIGCGQDYTPTDYVIDDDALYAFGSAAAARALPSSACEQLLQLVSGPPKKNTLQQIQRLFYQQRELLIATASHWLPVAAGVVHLYNERIGQTAQQESGGKNVINKLEIERTFFNSVDQTPVIPGSSLKGAIRTALLEKVNNGADLNEREKNWLKSKKEFEQQRANRELQQRILLYQPGKRNEYGREGLEKDPMRRVHIADACWTGDRHTVGREICFAVNRPKRQLVDAPHKQSMAQDKGPPQLLETLLPQPRAFAGQFMLHDLTSVNQPAKLPETRLHWSKEDIVQACNAFYRPLLENELALLDQRSFAHPDWIRTLRSLLEGELGDLLDSGQAFLLRVGRHSGAEAVTLNGVRSIRIMLGKDKETRKQRSTWEPQSRTVWLGAEAQDVHSEMVPFGWLLLEVDAATSPALLNKLPGVSIDLQSWSSRQQSKISTLRDTLATQQAQTQRLAQARERQQQAEAEHARQREQMSEEERVIDDLRRWFEEDQANNTLTNQGRVTSKFSELVQSATSWPAASKAALADLGETIYHSLGMLSGKKGKQRKTKLEALRQP